MADRALEITLRCATDLKKVNIVSKMDVYAVVSISGGSDSKKIRTPADRGGGSRPTWNFPIRFSVEEDALLHSRLTLDFKLVCERTLGDKDVGEVHVPIKELIDSPADDGRTFVSYQVTKPSGRPKGQLTFSYKFIGYNRKPSFPARPVADLESESKSKSVIPLAEKTPPKPMAMYPVVELESKSLYPAIEAAEALCLPPAYPAPYKYGYPSPEPSYWYPPSSEPSYWYAPSPGNLYPPLPLPEYTYSPILKAARVNNNFGSSVICS